MSDIPIISYEISHDPALRDPDNQMLGHQLRDPDNTILGPFSNVRTVSAQTLALNFRNLIELLGESLELPEKLGSFQVDALDVQLELTAEGQIGLLGNGGKLGGKGSLTLRLKRS